MVLKDVRPIIAELVRLKKSIPLWTDVGRYFPEIRKNTHGEAVRGGIKKALRAIEQAPTIDAVEMVRCKDCKNWGYGIPGDGEEVRVCIENAEIAMPDDGFCHKGERRADRE